MIVLIQDSQGISSATVKNIKTVVQRMLTQLSSESTDFNFALAKYTSSRRMSCFGSADETITYMNNKYRHGRSGRNRLKRALSNMILKQFEKRRGDRKTDTAKVRFTFCISGVTLNSEINNFKFSALSLTFNKITWYQEDRGFDKNVIKLERYLYCYRKRNILQDNRSQLLLKSVIQIVNPVFHSSHSQTRFQF